MITAPDLYKGFRLQTKPIPPREIIMLSSPSNKRQTRDESVVIETDARINLRLRLLKKSAEEKNQKLFAYEVDGAMGSKQTMVVSVSNDLSDAFLESVFGKRSQSVPIIFGGTSEIGLAGTLVIASPFALAPVSAPSSVTSSFASVFADCEEVDTNAKKWKGNQDAASKKMGGNEDAELDELFEKLQHYFETEEANDWLESSGVLSPSLVDMLEKLD